MQGLILANSHTPILSVGSGVVVVLSHVQLKEITYLYLVPIRAKMGSSYNLGHPSALHKLVPVLSGWLKHTHVLYGNVKLIAVGS